MAEAEAQVAVSALTDIYMTSGLGIKEDGFYPFVTITCQDARGNMFKGTSSPQAVREMALRWLEAAEAADQDRIVMVMMTRDLGLEPDTVSGFIQAMRNERDGPGDVTEVPGEDIETSVEKEADRDERTADQEAGGKEDRLVDPDEGRDDDRDGADREEDQQELGGEGG